MMSLSRTPSSIASRVRSGRQSIARRRSSSAVCVSGRIVFGLAVAVPGAYAPALATPRRCPPAERVLAMKLGVHIGYWGLGLTSADQLAIVQEAERLGFDSVWTAEAYGSDAATILAWLAGQTSTI